MGAGAKKKDRWVVVRRLGIALAALLLLAVVAAWASGPGDLKGAKTDYAAVQLRALARASRLYRKSTGHWPHSVDALEQAKLLPAKLSSPEYGLLDPWGRPFVLTPHGAGLEIRSNGEDPGDPSDDIALVVTAAPPAKRSP